MNAASNEIAKVGPTFTPGAACPINGSDSISANGGPVLKSAVELLFDDRGDDDGLCEANEVCVYTPHVGGYQGEGGYTAPCTYSANGGIAGVTLVGYSQI